jgi:ppGpp synthetase/RelA/SpoT-type nucleotidyltranferase
MSAGRPYETPHFSKRRVDKAGERIGTAEQTDNDLEVLENWRAAHANILNTFKTLLYNRAKDFHVQIAQRLKRRPTIIDKLTREPDMHLSRMHDIAGCRVIFPDLEDLYEFRAKMHEARFDHKRRGVEDDRWNYIREPKDSGYRGIHDVYTYHVEPKKGRAAEKQPWNGMLVEIQYRTKAQHAWATAVELAGLVTENNPKFDRGSPDFIQFFRLSSEILARAFEGATSCFPGMATDELLERFTEFDARTHLMDLFSQLKRADGGLDLSSSSILIFHYATDRDDDGRLEVRTFESVNAAIQEYNRLEQDLSDRADIVLVGSRSGESIKSAYRNYFSDAEEFLSLMRDGIGLLQASLMFPDAEDGLVEA